MENLNIVSLPRTELDQIRDMWESLKSLHVGLDHLHPQAVRKAEFEARKEEFLSRPQLLIEVAQCNESLVGYCVSYVDDRGEGEVDSIFVEPAYRGSGLGKRFVSRAFAWMDGLDVKTRRVAVLAGNESAVRFYQEIGFKTRLLGMVMQRD